MRGRVIVVVTTGAASTGSAAAADSSLQRLRNAFFPWPFALRARGTNCPSTTGFVRRRPCKPKRRTAAFTACAAASWVS